MQWLRVGAVPAAGDASEDAVPVPVPSIEDPAATTPRSRAASAGSWVALALEITVGAIGIAVGLGLAMVFLALVAAPAQAATFGPERDGPGGAAALILEADGGDIVAPLVSSEATITVTGPVLRARVVQQFVNPPGLSADDAFLEATYLFPLADGAAVDHLALTVGERRIEGRILERDAARAGYVQARDAGRRTALLEALRPNAFRTRVANIAAGETVTVEIEYQQTLAPADGSWQLRFPTVVAPRYSRDGSGGELAQPFLRPMAGDDATRAGSAIGPATYRLAISIDPGFTVAAPRSSTHRIATRLRDPAGGTARGWRVDVDEQPGDRDFVLEWRAAPSSLPRAALRLETRGAETYGLLVVDPPQLQPQPMQLHPTRSGAEPWLQPAAVRAEPAPLARELTLVIDTSGSMGGTAIEQARAAVRFALDRLRPDDVFNVIEFNSTHRTLFAAHVAADADNLARARHWVDRLAARGGTEMRGALAQALTAPPRPGTLGQVVFVTDGAVDDEAALMTQIEHQLGDRRLFTVAIGSAPNSTFLRKSAELGGGTLTQIGQLVEVERRMAALFARLSQPASTDLAIDVAGATLLDAPRLPRDLYAGEPLVTLLRLSGRPTQVRLSGRHDEPWQLAVDVADAGFPIAPRSSPADPDDGAATADAGLHVLWARDAIEAIDDRLRRLPPDAAETRLLRRQAASLAIEHHLVTRHTSLVAVDPTAVRDLATPVVAAGVPSAMPAGWTLPQTATSAVLQLVAGLALLAVGFVVLGHRRFARALAAFCHRTAR